jgi:hypothetical protein
MKVPSFTFAGGVLSPGLYGRVDLNKYQTGLKTAQNMIISVEGGVDKRPGLYFTGKRKFQDKQAKLIPWRIADDDSYMLEFGDYYIRFIRFGGYVSIPDSFVHHADNEAANVSGLMELETIYPADVVAELKYTFANDIMYIYHKDYPPQQLRRLGLYDWQIIAQSFDPHADFTGTVTATYTNSTIPADNYVPELVPTEYRVSATLSTGIETKACDPVSVDADLGHQRTKVVIEWEAQADAIQYTVYKGKNGIFGFIGYTTALEYTDKNFAPAYDVVPLGEVLAFPDEEYPRTGEFWKQRMAYAAPASEPQSLRFSRPLIFDSLIKSIPLQDDDAIQVALVGRERHTINHMIELKKFIIFTDTAEWVIGTDNNAALTAATIDPVIETRYGTLPFIRPIAIADRILFIQAISNSVRDMGYEYTSDSFKADDLSRLARHLFLNKQVLAWDYAIFPFNLLPIVVSDGTLNVMSYAREHEIWGWAHWETQGKIIDVACVAERTETGIYLQVEREIDGVPTYFVERVETVYSDLIEDMFYVDCGLTYKNAVEFTDFTWISATEVSITIVDTIYTETNEVQLEIAGLTYRGIVNDVTGDVVTLDIIHNGTVEETLAGSGIAYLCTTTVTGLDHIEGEDIWVLADGNVFKELTIASGELTLPYPAARVHVGLPYSATVETLSLDTDKLAGTFINRAVGEIVVNLRQSRGVYIGAAAAKERELISIPSRDQENYFEPNEPLNGPYRIEAHPEWEMTAAVIVQSLDPLPMNISNIVPDITYEG